MVSFIHYLSELKRKLKNNKKQYYQKQPSEKNFLVLF